ncbi:hypothetical protein CYLTODRAFT_458264 [Cylindrobasidium torrendii FP15055 ss-10]|uniref:Uncharacterized protein n=1 Tax=Cylindrobasidium torrendii FP15055 ss-10 TaxID=1314674 RepID=A0A0D7AZE1_9AGAR|nr:hypothetical protein CYLTODRAFT_458264 [Cylindrobasidium torrendii FP15055 ss-10]
MSDPAAAGGTASVNVGTMEDVINGSISRSGSPVPSTSSGSSESIPEIELLAYSRRSKDNDLGIFEDDDSCDNITDRWLQSRNAAILKIRHCVRDAEDVLSQPHGSFDVGDMRYLFDDPFTALTPKDTWFPHGLVPYEQRFEYDTLDTLIDFYQLFDYETFLCQVNATNGPRILKLMSIMWNPVLATPFFNALNVAEHRFGADTFFERCTDMLRPRQWEHCWQLIDGKFSQLAAADRGTRNRLGRLGFPVEACSDRGLGLPPFLPAVGKVQ